MSLVPESRLVTPEQIAYLRSVDSPTIANAVETFSLQDRTTGFVGGNVRALFPDLGVMVGYALTVTVSNEPGPVHSKEGFWRMFQALSEMPTPSVLVMQDISGAPHRVAYAGEVMATLSKRLGAVGMVTDGGFRDLDEVRALGIYYYARFPVVSHANFRICEVGVPVTLDGQRIDTGDLLHGDGNGIVVVPHAAVAGMEAAIDQIRERERKTMEYYRSDSFTIAEAKAQAGY